MWTFISYGATLIAGFVGGVLVARKNRKMVEAAVTVAKTTAAEIKDTTSK